MHVFQFTHPVWGATQLKEIQRLSGVFQFTHPVWGATDGDMLLDESASSFNSRTPCGVRHIARGLYSPIVCFNSRTPCGVRLVRLLDDAHTLNVSIHAPRVGCDIMRLLVPHRDIVSIHAPRVGCDIMSAHELVHVALFQFTHPVWGATLARYRVTAMLSSFNSRTPCGVRRGSTHSRAEPHHVSIHAPRVGCDDGHPCQLRVQGRVSIHAPRVGCDL